MESKETYYAWPLDLIVPADELKQRRSEASMAELHNGDALLVYANHVGRSDNATGHIAGIRVNPQGKTVGEEWIVMPTPEGGLNAMSPALRRLPDGRLGMLFSYRMSTKVAFRKFATSSDEGKTWSEAVTITEGGYKTGCHDRFLITSTGRFLAPLHCTDDWDKHYMHVRVGRSDDGGNVWSVGDPISLPQLGTWEENRIESGCIEPGIAERSDGSLLMTIRTAMGTQFCAESFDMGETWSSLRSMEVISPQAPANLTRIPGTSDLLLLWTPTYDSGIGIGGMRNTIMACVSTDGGRSWPHAKRKLLLWDPEHSVDYPSVMYKGNEVWITLRRSSGPKILQGMTSTGLMRVPVQWF